MAALPPKGERPNVLVTGGAGYIGSHVCKRLAEAGYLPVTYDSMISGHVWAVKWGPLEHGDILDTDHLQDVLYRYRPVAVMHLAAHIDSAESVANPDKYFRNNVDGSASLLQAMQEVGLDRLVFSSTAAVYGTPQSTPIAEDHPLQPISPYGESKLMVEKLIFAEAKAHGLRVAILRYFNAAGADYQAGIGEHHDPETHLIPRLLSAASRDCDAIVVNGTDYPTPDGSCVRDYVHVSDLAAAHLLSLHRLEAQGNAAIFNLGGGSGASVRQVIDTVQRITGSTIAVRLGERRAGDPPELLSDIRRAARELGWRPKRSGLDSIVSDAWQWHMRRNA